MDYQIRLMTRASTWDSCPRVVLKRDWTLKEFRKNENRLALIEEAMNSLGLTYDEVTVCRLDLVEGGTPKE